MKSFISGKAEPTKAKPYLPEKKSKNNDSSEASEIAKRTKRSERGGEAKKPKAEPVPVLEARVAVTTRFRQATAEALRRLSLERKLRGERPWSQQEIIETAVNNWLITGSKS